VRERSWLPELRVGSNDDMLFDHSGVDLARPCAGNFLIMAKKRPGDAQKIALHIEIVGALRLPRRLSIVRRVVFILGRG
jgi:hypothetical protein